MQRPSQGPINRASETFIKASTCYSIDANASAALQASTERHQRLKMAPLRHERTEHPPLYIRDLLSMSSHTSHPFSVSQLLRITCLRIAERTGLALSTNKTHFTLRERPPQGEPTSVPTKMLLARCVWPCLLAPDCMQRLQGHMLRDGEVNRRCNKRLQFIYGLFAHGSCQSGGIKAIWGWT